MTLSARIVNNKVMTLSEVYEYLWSTEEYRRYTISSSDSGAEYLMTLAKPPPGSTVIDFGCGRGRTAACIVRRGMFVTMIDFVDNSLDDEVRELIRWKGKNGGSYELENQLYREGKLAGEPSYDKPTNGLEFLKADIEDIIPIKADYGVCYEVMEHIPTSSVDRVISNIMTASPSVVFSISVVPDLHDHLLGGEPIHLTVKPLMWWLRRFDEQDCRIEFIKQAKTGFLLHVTRHEKH